MSEAVIRSYIRAVLIENRILTEAPAKNWEDYVKKTTKKYAGLQDAGKDVDEAYVVDFVKKYKNIVQKFDVFQKQENNPVADKAAKIFSDMMKFEPGMTDSFDDFKKWYVKFNKSELGKTYRDVDTFADNPKYLSAVAIMDLINSTEFVFNDLMVPDKMELPPAIERLPEEEKEEKIAKAEDKIKTALEKAIVQPARDFAAKFDRETKSAEDVVAALPKEDQEKVAKTQAEIEKEFLDKYDRNKDGKMSAIEFALMNMAKRGEL